MLLKKSCRLLGSCSKSSSWYSVSSNFSTSTFSYNTASTTPSSYSFSPSTSTSSSSSSTSTSSTSTSSTYSNEKQTHFGFRNVGEEEKKEAVLGVFHSVADSYDLMNDAMSLGIHRVWKDMFIRRLGPGPTTRLLDVAGGTGDIAFRFLDAAGRPSAATAPTQGQGAAVTVCDINKSMLRVGEARAEKLGTGLEVIPKILKHTGTGTRYFNLRFNSSYQIL